MTITESNVSKVISAATGAYWAVAGLLLWSDFRSGDLQTKEGWWIAVMLFTGTCGVGFWAVLAPFVIRSFQSGSSTRGLRGFGRWVWCFSTLPAVLLCFGMLCLLVYYRITE